jgi:pimeloyl-ACP methyl ester carboxylesterase
VWGPCPVEILDECTSIEVPLDWSAPDGAKLEIWASRSLAKQQPATTQLWLLDGGPGASGYGYGRKLPLLAELLPNVDHYVLVHRGTGLSGFLTCPEQEVAWTASGTDIAPSEVLACAEALGAAWGEGLAGFSTTGDAMDLQRFVARTREPGKRVVAWGVSYGTMRAMRFLQLYPSDFDAVVLDGIVAPGAQFFSRWDGQADVVGRRLAALCAQSEACSARLGSDPWARLTTLHTKLHDGHCAPLGLSANDFATFGETIVSLGARSVHEHLFPIVYRLDRCEPGDVSVLRSYFQSLLGWLEQAWGRGFEGYSQALYYHVALSELWEDPPPTLQELQARNELCSLCDHRWALGMALRHAAWPRYEDALAGQWPSTDMPVLAWNGGLDAQTTFATACLAAGHFGAEHQHFLEAPFAAHGVLELSEGKTTCSGKIFAGFVSDPTAPVDGSCLAEDRRPTWVDHTGDVG